jgi:thioredoxin reductase
MRSAIIIGGGPAGLSAARTLAKAGHADVLVLERNPEAGGLPRFAGHLGWGVLDFHRLWSGPTYARKLVAAARDVEIRTNASVTALLPGGGVEVSTPAGLEQLRARTVLLAAGIREMPRGARLLSGTRPWGVVSTGAFQEMVYAGGIRPFQRPVIIGTELVSFSAIMTARHAGIRPVAMLEEAPRITARRPGDWIARHVLGVPVHTGTRLVAIEGNPRVEAVLVEHAGQQRRIACDGVILSGRFVPEAALARAGMCWWMRGRAAPPSTIISVARTRPSSPPATCCGRSSTRAPRRWKASPPGRPWRPRWQAPCRKPASASRCGPAGGCAMSIRNGWCRMARRCGCSPASALSSVAACASPPPGRCCRTARSMRCRNAASPLPCPPTCRAIWRP